MGQVKGRRRLTRTPKVRTALSRPCPAGQKDSGQRFFIKSGQNPGADRISTDRNWTAFFLKIRTESGQQTDTRPDFPENPDKNETRTGHGQCYPPTSDNQFMSVGKNWDLLRFNLYRINYLHIA